MSTDALALLDSAEDAIVGGWLGQQEFNVIRAAIVAEREGFIAKAVSAANAERVEVADASDEVYNRAISDVVAALSRLESGDEG